MGLRKITNDDLKMVLVGVNKKGKVKFPIYETEKFYNYPIDILEITNTRAINMIKRNKIFTIKDLMLIWNDLDHIKGLGNKSVLDIKYSLCKFQFSLLDNLGKKNYLQRIIDLNF